MIPIYEPFLNGNEKKYVNDCLDSSWISSRGKYISLFEDEIKNFVGRKFASSCSNGTTALDLAMKALGIGNGDEVITTSFTYVASTNSILINDATPVFIDIEKESWNMNATLIERVITNKTKAIIISNVYGYLPNIDEIQNICNKYNLFLIEDSAESLGASYKNKMSGSFGDISTFSFFGNKTITSGEGGMVLTDCSKLHSRINILKNQGNSPDRKYFHSILGYNYRMTNIQAAIGLAQFEQLNKIKDLKKKIYEIYHKELSPFVNFQNVLHQDIIPSYWIITILLDNEAITKKIIKKLQLAQIETRPLFFPIDELPFYSQSNNLPITKNIYKRGLCLPSYPGLAKESQLNIISIIKQTLIENNG